MNREEAKAYYRKLAADNGLSKEQITAAMVVFDNEKFLEGVMPTPEFSRGLDAERQKLMPIQKRNDYLEKEWLPSAQAAYDKNVRGIELLDKYRQQYGDFTDDGTGKSNLGEVQNAAAVTGLSEEAVANLLDSRLAARDRATLDLMEVRENYMDTFKERMPVGEFENFVAEKRQGGSFDSLTALYRDWVDPRMEKIRGTQAKEHDKRVAEEAVKDYASRNKIPVENRRRETHLLFDREVAGEKPDTSGRDAFLEAINDPELVGAGGDV